MVPKMAGAREMTDPLIAAMTRAVSRLRIDHHEGRVVAARGGALDVAGLARVARLGDRVAGHAGDHPVQGEVIRVTADGVHVLPEGGVEGIALGTRLRLSSPPPLCPDDSWIGRTIDPDGKPLDGRPLLPGPAICKPDGRPPPARERRSMGARLPTGHAVFDTLLPIARGQRIGLFAGSGVGKSTMLAGLARQIEADVVVIGLVGERGREVRHFTDVVMGPEGMARAVIVAATSDRAPQVRRRAARTATAVAEHFRAEGRQVLLIIDSVTRFAEAHREIAIAAGEPAALRGFPASTATMLATLCERAGPGRKGEGDITAIYSVLVAGSDMEEPVADWLRGLLDGHVVLDRSIAERGRFPAVDLVRSVSRSLPDVADAAENRLIAEARRLLGTYDRVETMVRAGLYSVGTDAEVDAAINAWPALDRFAGLVDVASVAESFGALRQALDARRHAPGRGEQAG
jgi:flagellum-specific ATP synthase